MEMMRHPFQHRALRCLTLLLCAASPLFAQSPQGAPGKLKFVIIFSRHGVRTPAGSSEQLNQYSAQPWPKWDSPSGNLTDQGATLIVLKPHVTIAPPSEIATWKAWAGSETRMPPEF